MNKQTCKILALFVLELMVWPGSTESSLTVTVTGALALLSNTDVALGFFGYFIVIVFK